MEHFNVLANSFNQSKLKKECEYVIYDMLNLAAECFSSILCPQTNFFPSRETQLRPQVFKPWEEVLLLKISSQVCVIGCKNKRSLSLCTFTVSIYIEIGQNK